MAESEKEFSDYRERMRVKRLQKWLQNNQNHAKHIAEKINEIGNADMVTAILTDLAAAATETEKALKKLQQMHIDMMKAALAKADAEVIAMQVAAKGE